MPLAWACVLRREEVQVNGIRHGLISGGIEMKIVAAVRRQQILVIRRVAHRGIEINDAVENGICPDPGIHELAFRLMQGAVITALYWLLFMVDVTPCNAKLADVAPAIVENVVPPFVLTCHW